MKKLISLMLAMALLLSAAAFAEEADVTGVWYFNAFGQTITMTLNEDGTAVNQMDDQTVEGTWTREGDQVTLYINGEEDGTLTFDGETLKDATGMLTFTRELTDNPSGLDDLVNSLMNSLGGEWTDAEATPAVPQGEVSIETETDLTVEKANLMLTDSYGTTQASYIAKVVNNGEEATFITDGSMTVLDAEGNTLGESTWISYTGSTYLEPGEATFVSFNADYEGEAAGCKAVITTAAETYYSKDVALEVAEAVYTPKDPDDFWGSNRMRVTVTNTTDENLAQINVVMVLEDEEGTLLSIATSGLYQNELTPGSSIVFVDDVWTSVTDWCAANGKTPSQVEAMAWYTVRDD